MDNERLIAQISQREDASVDKVASLKIKSSPIITRMQRADELRRKTIKVEGLNKSRFCKLKLQESFDLLQKALPFEYGENLEIFLKTNEFEVFSRWVEGTTLSDANKKDSPLKVNDFIRLRNRIRFWVRIFEYLSFYHAKGIIHGNLKPQNILIRDRATVDIKVTYESEFFERKEEIPHIIFLDGGYAHFLPSSYEQQNNEERISIFQKIVEKNYWLAPEARGLIEGSYRESSDIFSLAAIMAWDLGLIKDSGLSVLEQIWSAFLIPESNTFILGNDWYKWTTRHPIFETLKRLRTILLKALEPLPEKRISNAREIAFELIMLSNKLTDNIDVQNINNIFSNYSFSHSDKHNQLLLNKNFDIPEQVSDFILQKSNKDKNRLWIDAKTIGANKHLLMRNLCVGLNIINKHTFFYPVKFSSLKIPFSTLNDLCESLLNYAIFLNPKFLQEMKSIFFNLGNQVEILFYILPSLKKYAENKNVLKKSTTNSLIQITHEWLYSNIEKIFERIISSSEISFIIIDDINRSDFSSLPVLLNIIKKNSINNRWILGIRSEEDIFDEEIKKTIQLLKSQDVIFSNLKDDRTRTYWVSKLNHLTSQQARFLATWAMADLKIDTDIIELLSSKVINLKEIFSEKYHEGKEDINTVNSEINDLIQEESKEVISDQAKPTEVDEDSEEKLEKRKKDPLHLAYETLNVAIKVGLVSENRDILTGHLISYYWEHQFIWLSLSLLLNKDIKSKIYYLLSEHLCNKLNEKTTLSEIIQISEYLSRSDLKKCAYSAYSALLIATEDLCDYTSTEFIISKLQMLSENIEKESPDEAPVLIPKIREHIADLSLSLGKYEQAEKYYQAVSWNTVNLKRKAILTIKSFFPSQIKKREKRTDEFYKLIHLSEAAGIIEKSLFETKSSYIGIIESEIYKIQKKLQEQTEFLSKVDSNNLKILMESITNPIEFQENAKQDKTKLFPKMRPVRSAVMSRFFRSCIGWIDNNILIPQIVRVLNFTIESNDGESIVHLLFSLLICAERNIPSRLRALIIETILELSGRLGNDLNIFEAYLLKAWSSIFYDGNLLEGKKNIDKINSSMSNDLPFSLRQCTRKLQILIEFESMSFDTIKNHKNNPQKYLKKFQDYNLTEWYIGNVIFSVQQSHYKLKRTPGDELFIGNILDEKTDQLLLLTHLLFEKGHAHAAAIITQEAKEVGIRQWFVDPSTHIEFVPELFANKMYELSTLKKKVFASAPQSKANRFLNQIKTLKKFMTFTKQNSLKYWGEDRAILTGNKIEKANTQDTERLHFLSQTAILSGFHWTAYRLALKARTDIIVIIDDLKDIENTVKGHASIRKDQTSSTELISQNLTRMSENQGRYDELKERTYVNSEAYPEQGVAINYVLEFLHNFQNNIQNSKLSEEELFLLANMIRRSIPKDSDIIESTLAGALKASAKRMILKDKHPESAPAKEQQNSQEEEKSKQNEQENLKQTG
ncbi:hypothetical protein QEJ31_11330 [Pigmentibacter sp. JX0631]|uniref:hypothetical protein n=1 Tax=Pigmentibacter sp. JX0631 TaxID=2976982 RepID=UPI0024697E2E|nr:hypothetical protein [Pigmentibacter sp. JX0631]WGL59112.1 hypothetical protein QEJ31_11330 [Pigmentibacter sp. JX0631]